MLAFPTLPANILSIHVNTKEHRETRICFSLDKNKKEPLLYHLLASPTLPANILPIPVNTIIKNPLTT